MQGLLVLKRVYIKNKIKTVFKQDLNCKNNKNNKSSDFSGNTLILCVLFRVLFLPQITTLTE